MDLQLAARFWGFAFCVPILMIVCIYLLNIDNY